MADPTMQPLTQNEVGLLVTALATMKQQNSRTAVSADSVPGAPVEAQDAFHTHNAEQQALIDSLMERINDAGGVYLEERE